MRASTAMLFATLVSSLSFDVVRAQVIEDSPYLFVFAGDKDEADSDFLAVIDVKPGSSDFGQVIATAPIGMKASMPHHTEYVMPPPASCCS